MAVKIDNNKFLGIEKVSAEIIKPKQTFNPLKEINENLGYANTLLREFGVENGLKGLIKSQIEKFKGNNNVQEQQNQPQYDFQPQEQIIKQQEQPQEKMKFDKKKLNAIIDLVIRFKGEDFKVSELKDFLNENGDLIDTILN